MHHIKLLFLYFYVRLPLVFLFFFSLSISIVSILLILSIMVRKTRAYKTSTFTPSPTFDSGRFLSEKNQEAYEKLNLRKNIGAKRKVLLDELNPKIRHNFERRGWLPFLDISHPPLATLITEFYLNLSVHVYDYNTLIRS